MTNPQMSADQALSIIASELSASAADALLDNNGAKFTLRGAIKRILWKVNFLLPLVHRPVDPTKPDDQFGHVLSARVEGLITQAIIADLAARLGTDVKKIRADVIASLNVHS